MAYSFNRYVGDGETVDYTLSFPYISASHITVTVQGLEVTNWEWVTTNSIQFDEAPLENSVIQIYRTTPKDDRLVDFQAGSILDPETLNLDSTQLIYIMQEVLDGVAQYQATGDPSFIYDRDQIANLLTGYLDESHLTADLSSAITYAKNLGMWEEILVDGVVVDGLYKNVFQSFNDQFLVMAAQLSAHGITLGEHGDSLDLIDTTVDGLSSTLTAQGVTLAAHDATLTSQGARITVTESSIVTHAGQISTNANGLSAAVADIVVESGRIDLLTTDVAAIDGRVTTNEADITAAEGTISLHTSTINTIEGDITTIEGDITTIEGDITTIEGDVSSQDTRLTNAEGQVVTLQGDLSDLTDDFNTLDAVVQTNTADITAAQGTISLHTSTITTIEGDLSTAEGNITTLEGDLDSLDTVVQANVADITVANGRIDANVADITSVNGELDTHEAQLSLMADEFFVKLDANGNVSGFGLYNGTTSQFTVNADKFAVIKADGTGSIKKPFVIDTATSTIAIDGNMMVQGSISANKISTTTLSALAANIGTVTAGILQSTNYVSGTTGLQFDLTNNTLKMYSAGAFKVEGSGRIDLKPTNGSGGLRFIWSDNSYIDLLLESTYKNLTLTPQTANVKKFQIGFDAATNTAKRLDTFSAWTSYSAHLDCGNGSTLRSYIALSTSATRIYSLNSGQYAYLDVTPYGAQTQGHVYPTAHKTYDLGTAALAWQYCYAYSYPTVADFYHLDDRMDVDGNIVPVDDMAVLKAIQPSDNYSPTTGLRLINDSTIPTWLAHKHSEDGGIRAKDEDGRDTDEWLYRWKAGDVAYSPDGRPYLELKTVISLLMGAVRQLDDRIERIESNASRKPR